MPCCGGWIGWIRRFVTDCAGPAPIATGRAPRVPVTRRQGVLFAALVCCALLFGKPVAAQFVTSINGVMLLQNGQSVHAALGRPDLEMRLEAGHAEQYRIGDSAWIMFGYSDVAPQLVSSIRLYGHLATMEPVAGLRLGDTAERVRELLGEPVQKIETEPPGYTEWRFEHFNGALEFDGLGRLYGIRIQVTREFEQLADANARPFDDFLAVLERHDAQAIVDWLAPDVEVYRGDDVLSIDRPFAAFRAEPDAELLRTLDGPSGSVLSEARAEPPVPKVRVWDTRQSGLAYRFEHSKLLEEVVFVVYAGRWKVWEVSFREGAGRNAE